MANKITSRPLSIKSDGETTIVKPVEAQDSRTAFAPCVTAGAPAQHFEKLSAAFDSALGQNMQWAFEQTAISSAKRFLGYGVLQNLSQDALIRLCIKNRSEEMLREWIDIKAEGDKKTAIEDEITRLTLRDLLGRAVALMGYMGGAYLFIDTGVDENELVNPLNISEKSGEIRKGTQVSFRVIDPFFTTPQAFNASNPLKEDFYKPSVFYVMGTPVHRSRLIRFVENEVTDLLKPSYNFLGIPQAQLLSDYVTHFRENREEANRLLKKFSTMFLKSNIKNILYNGASRGELDKRVKLFVRNRDNNGLMVLDKDSEDLMQINTPLTGVEPLVRQSLELVVAVNQSNVVKMLGMSPAGFNTGESDLKSHNDLIATLQATVLKRPLEKILKILQLSLFGAIDPAVSFEFCPLDTEDERELADTQKVKADTAAIYLDRGVLTEDEVRDSLKNDETSPFHQIEGDAPEADDVPFAQMTDPTEGTHEKDADK